jgi:uncharacterized protein DUF3226
MSVQVVRTKLLIVEGKDEENFFSAALVMHLKRADIQVLPIGGKTNLSRNLNELKNDPAFVSVESLAVVRDADVTMPGATTSAAAGAFASVCGSLAHVGLPHPAAHGTFVDGPPRVGIYIMPNGIDDGTLETLCTDAVSGEPEFHCLEEYFACLVQHQVVLTNIHKARAHAWLASRPESDKRLGEAALAGYWPWRAAEFLNLLGFIQSL